MSLDSIFHLLFYLILIFETIFLTLPLGTDGPNKRIFPLVSSMLIALNLYVFAMTMTPAEKQEYEYSRVTYQLLDLLEKNPAMLKLSAVQEDLRKADLIFKDKKTFEEKIPLIEGDVVLPEKNDQQAFKELGSSATLELKNKFDELIAAYKTTVENSIYYRFGLAPNGNWKFHQLLTHMFLHGDGMHLLGNMIFLFVMGWGLEEWWKPGAYIGFYVLAGIAACLPDIIVPHSGPSVGASGAIAGIMGACLVSLRKTKLKVGYLSIPGAIFLLMFGKKPFGIVRVPAKVYLTFYFVSQLTFWMVTKKDGIDSRVAYSAHVGGFVFGVLFAAIYEYYQSVRHPEAFAAKVAAQDAQPAPEPAIRPAVAEAIELLQNGRITEAELKLKVHLFTYTEDTDAMKALVGIYQRLSSHEKAREMSARLIKNYLRVEDKPSALLAYLNLVRMLAKDQIDPQVPPQYLIVLCEQMRKQGMNREAIVECERFVKAYRDDPLAPAACVMGGEAALSISDKATAMRLFEAALQMGPSTEIEARARRGIEVCRHIVGSGRSEPLQRRQV